MISPKWPWECEGKMFQFGVNIREWTFLTLSPDHTHACVGQVKMNYYGIGPFWFARFKVKK